MSTLSNLIGLKGYSVSSLEFQNLISSGVGDYLGNHDISNLFYYIYTISNCGKWSTVWDSSRFNLYTFRGWDNGKSKSAQGNQNVR